MLRGNDQAQAKGLVVQIDRFLKVGGAALAGLGAYFVFFSVLRCILTMSAVRAKLGPAISLGSLLFLDVDTSGTYSGMVMLAFGQLQFSAHQGAIGIGLLVIAGFVYWIRVRKVRALGDLLRPVATPPMTSSAAGEGKGDDKTNEDGESDADKEK